MKKTFLYSFSILLALVSFKSSAQNKYKIDLQVKGLSDSVGYLAYYYGKGMYYRDTANFDKQGNIQFTGKDTLASGMYSLIYRSDKLFDIMLDVQEFSMSTDTSDYTINMKTKGSKENDIFYEYMRFINTKQQYAQSLFKKKDAADEKEKKEIDKTLTDTDTEVRAFIAKLHKAHKGSLTSNFIYSTDSPKVPTTPKNPDGSIDSTFGFYYYKTHYFDNFDFNDERLLRTPSFNKKMMYYVDKLTLQDADSIIASVDYLLNKVKDNKTLFKFTLSQLTSKYERSENMGFDAIFVHLGKSYFMKGKANEWFSDDQMKKMAERVTALDPLLIGKQAPNIVVKDTSQTKFLELYDVEAEYTILYIWSPDCGHCKTATPKLKKLYDKMKDKGVKVFAVGNDYENEPWIKFINKHNLDWINGSDGPSFRSNYQRDYDVFSTPQTYLLDKNKKSFRKK
ncbi:MAG: redoxin domain-containing protein [Flavobacteriales bacterium]|nr:redoxin domain-containing protein [Flavobacteriales bacterium]